MMRSAHAVADGERVWLIDPFDDVEALEAAKVLGEPVAVLQLLDRHQRDCTGIADRLGVPLLQMPAAVAGAPFEVVKVVSRAKWNEIALWWEQQQTLIVSEAIGTAPLFALGRHAGVHPLMRLTPPSAALGRYAPQLLLVGHGPPLVSDAADALAQALRHARGDIPKLVLSLPKAIRDR